MSDFLGMNLPKKFVTGHIRETYYGRQQRYHGTRIWVIYFERDYVNGIASDKISDNAYKNQFFFIPLADLLGRAAAINLIVARADQNGRPMFDDGDEIIQVSEETGLPIGLTVSDHTGTFRNYRNSCYDNAHAYAEFIMHHAKKVTLPGKFINTFLEAFEWKFKWTQEEYLRRKRGFDRLFSDFPKDERGNLAYRWEIILDRLIRTDVRKLTETIRAEVKKIQSE
ncbi:MAG: hypothetical protein R6V06_02660 [Kiritimatiellia bacterium]